MPRHALLTPHSLGKQNTSEHRVPFSAKAVIFGKCGDTVKTGQQKRWRKEGEEEEKRRKRRRRRRTSAAFPAKLPQRQATGRHLSLEHMVYTARATCIASYRVKDFKTLLFHCQRRKIN